MVKLNYKDSKIVYLIKKYSKKKKLKVLDIGAAKASIKSFLPKKIEYTSLDIDPKYNPDIICDLNNKFPIKNEEYDFVVCSEVLEHTLYPKKIVSEIKRILKKDGKIIISLPNEYNFYLRLKFLLGKQGNDALPFREDLWMNHIHRPKVKDIINFCRNNFKIKEIFYSWESFSEKKSREFLDKFIRKLFLPLSKELFSRNVIVFGEK